jgi:hypothetical protein
MTKGRALLPFALDESDGQSFIRAAPTPKWSRLKCLREDARNLGSPKGALQIPPLRYATRVQARLHAGALMDNNEIRPQSFVEMVLAL